MSASGLNAQLGFAAEPTYGTYTAPTKFLEFVSESLALNIERLESAGLRARRTLTSSQWAPGQRSVEGDINLELSNVGQGLLWHHALGGSSTAGPAPAGVYTHTYVPADMQTQFLTIQVGKPAVPGTVHPFSYVGCKITGWEVSASAGEIAAVTFNILGRDEQTDQALATALYPANYGVLTFVGGSVSVGGSPVATVTAATVTGDNMLRDDRWYLGTNLRGLPVESGFREYTFSFDMDFVDLAMYDRYRNSTEAAVVLRFTGANIPTTSTPYEFRIEGNARFDGSTPTVGGPDILGQTVSGRFVGSGATDASALQIVRVTGEATATA